MGFPVILDRADCASVGVPLLQPGELTSLVLEQVQLDSEVGPVGPSSNSSSSNDVTGVSGSLHATTKRLIWLEDGASNLTRKRSCSMPLAAVAEVALSALPDSGILHEALRALCAAHLA